MYMYCRDQCEVNVPYLLYNGPKEGILVLVMLPNGTVPMAVHFVVCCQGVLTVKYKCLRC